MELVEVKRNEVYCDSTVLARKFDYQHSNITKNIRKLKKDLAPRPYAIRATVIEENRVYKGRPYKAYLMNREFFSLLVMRLKGPQALEWQIKFNDAFFEMEKQLLLLKNNKSDQKWLGTRSAGIEARNEETAVIKDFVDYATAQGSKNAKFYYKHVTDATYKALGLLAQKQPKLRDTLNIYQISELLLAERLAQTQIREYMNMGRNYKDIYQSVKEDLITFANSMRIKD